MPFRITMLLERLSDGRWHDLDQLKRLMLLDDYEVQEITRFLSQYDFAEIDKRACRVRVNRDFQKILASNLI